MEVPLVLVYTRKQRYTIEFYTVYIYMYTEEHIQSRFDKNGMDSNSLNIIHNFMFILQVCLNDHVSVTWHLI